MTWQVWVLVIGAAAAQGVGLRETGAPTPRLWVLLGIGYAILGGLALWGLWTRGNLKERVQPKSGDVTLGAGVALVLLLGSWVGRSVVAPIGSPRHAWLLKLYLVLGDPNTIQRSAAVTLTLLLIVAMDEIVWRGYVLDSLKERWGDRRAFIFTTLLYAAAALPTLFTLRDPTAGPNPLWVLVTFGTGLFWTFLTRITGRLPPSVISHFIFSYFTAVQFRLPGLLP